MADTFTSNYNLVIQSTGSNSGTWGTDLNNNAISPLDAILGGTQGVTLSSSNVTLSLTQWQHKAFLLTGTLTANVQLILPLSPNAVGGSPSVGGEFVVANLTTGNFSVLVTTAATGAVGVTVPQGGRTILYSDTVNVWYANDSGGIPIGAVMDFAAINAPAGWLLCAGQLVATARYPALFNLLGYFYGGAGGSFGIPDYRGRLGAGLDNMGGTPAGRIGTIVTDSGTIVGSTLGSGGGSGTHVQQGAEVGQHAHGVNDPQHTHGTAGGATIPSANTGQYASGSPSGQSSGSGGSLAPASTGITIQNNNAGAAVMAWLQPTIMTNKVIFAGA